jgi:hypothetical protein
MMDVFSSTRPIPNCDVDVFVEELTALPKK